MDARPLVPVQHPSPSPDLPPGPLRDHHPLARRIRIRGSNTNRPTAVPRSRTARGHLTPDVLLPANRRGIDRWPIRKPDRCMMAVLPPAGPPRRHDLPRPFAELPDDRPQEVRLQPPAEKAGRRGPVRFEIASIRCVAMFSIATGLTIVSVATRSVGTTGTAVTPQRGGGGGRHGPASPVG